MSETTQQTVILRVIAPDPMTEVYVINSDFQIAIDAITKTSASGRGSISAHLEPGIYNVKFRRGSAVEEQLVSLRPDSAQVTVTSKSPHLSFSVFFDPRFSKDTLNRYWSKSINDGMCARHEVGSGSEISLYVIDAAKDGHGSRFKGVSLKANDGEMLVNLDEAEPDVLDNGFLLITGAAASVDPGVYRLSVKTHTIGTLEQTVFAAEGWRTIILLPMTVFRAKRRSRRVDMSNLTVMMLRMNERTDFDHPFHQAAETARMALATGRTLTKGEEMKSLLHDKFQNPFLGLYAAHLLLKRENPDVDLLQTVLWNVGGLIPGHPDYLAVKMAVDDKAGQLIEACLPIFESPPMLRASWDIVVRYSRKYPDIVPTESLASRIGDRLWGGGAWLTWIRVDIASRNYSDVQMQSVSRFEKPSYGIDLNLISSALAPLAENEQARAFVRETLEDITQSKTFTDIVDSLKEHVDPWEIVRRYLKLNDTESSILERAVKNMTREIKGRGVRWITAAIEEGLIHPLHLQNALQEISTSDLVEALGLPDATVQRLVHGINRKIAKLARQSNLPPLLLETHDTEASS